ncbi:Helix-turn-helix domain-containing protein [Hydrogenobacter hydrogenophilus]|uniref:Helix-turn-helix domain-containing protein n=2 Tax=Hydrogenobacter hydrogenophilus TaxID=35835 RepID=A0A285P229_9AQUI|nr:Helix-turn-helix domain-containing protein [Hydrogenobacter hydrogenophilus]
MFSNIIFDTMAYQSLNVLGEEFIRYFEKEETICSLAIERIKIDLEEFPSSRPEDKRLLQAWNYYKTADDVYMLALNNRGKSISIITEALVLWVYNKLWEGFELSSKGYRKEDMVIFGAKFEPPRPEVIPMIMNCIIEWLNNNSLDAISKSNCFHLLFEVLHPFEDGNGRVGRILLNAILIENGLVNVAFRNRDAYLDAIKKAEDGAIIVIDKLARGRKLTNDQITETLLTYGDLKSMNDLVKKELIHSLKVQSRINQVLLDISKASYLLGFKNKDYVRVLINRGKIKAIKIDNRWKVPLSEIIEFIEREKQALENIEEIVSKTIHIEEFK